MIKNINELSVKKSCFYVGSVSCFFLLKREQYIYLFIYLFIYLSIYLSIYLYILLFLFFLSSITDYWNSLMGFLPASPLLQKALAEKRSSALAINTDTEYPHPGINTENSEESDTENNNNENNNNNNNNENNNNSAEVAVPLGSIDPDVLSIANVAYHLATV